MHFSYAFRPDLAAGSGGTRYSPDTFRVLQDGEHYAIETTDGRMLTRVPCTLDEADHRPHPQTPCFYPIAALRHAREYGEQRASEDADHGENLVPMAVAVALSNDNTASVDHDDGVSVVAVRPGNAYFPDSTTLWPKVDTQPEYVVTIDARRLLKLAEAIGSNGEMATVMLEFHGPTTPIVVRGPFARAIGLLMPMLQEDLPEAR